MAAGDITCTDMGTVSTTLACVAAIDGQNLATASDKMIFFIDPGIGGNRYRLVKIVRAP